MGESLSRKSFRVLLPGCVLQPPIRAGAKFGKLFSTFAAVAILIGCLGLLGLSAYSASLRVKEIGIRKVLGASVIEITTMLSLDFLKLIVLTLLIAAPLTWYGMQKWLEDFAYHNTIDWWIFAVAGLQALAIALLTVGSQAVKAALANPVKSLPSE